MDNKRAGNISEEQKSTMFEFMASHPELRKGKFSSTFTFKKAQMLWEQLTEQLNQQNGGKRDWKSWRKTWQDLCSRAKHKKCQISKHYRKTGGGEETQEKLSFFEENVTSLLGEVPINGHPNSKESLVVNFLQTANNDMEITEPFYDNINMENNIIIEEVELPSVHHISTIPNFEHCYAAGNSTSIHGIRNATTPKAVDYTSTAPNLEHCSATSNSTSNSTRVIRKPLGEVNSTTPNARVKRSYATQRLNNTISATEQLVAEMREKNKIKRDYYDKKLKLYEREVIAKEEYYKKKIPL